MRIQSLVLAGAVVVSSSAATHVLVACPERWTEFRMNGGNNVALSGMLERSWSVATGGGFSSSPAIAYNTLYIGNNGGRVFAIDPVTGKKRWEYSGTNPFMSQPLVTDGVVVVGEGNQKAFHDPADPKSDRLLVGTGENALIGLDAKSGRRLWYVPTKGTAMPTAAIVGDVLVHHDGAGYLTAVDPKTGAVRYQRNIKSVASMSAMSVLPGGIVVTTGSYPSAAIAVDARSGNVVWQHTFAVNASGVGDCPTATDGERVLCNYILPANGGAHAELGQSSTQHVYSLDARTGRLEWDVAMQSGPLPRYNEASIPLLDGGTLFEGNSCAPYVNAIDAKTGKTVWSTRVFSVVKGGISAKDGILYFGDNDGHLWALNERNGAVVGVKDLGPQFNVGSPVIAGNTMIIGSNTGSIIALPLRVIRDSRDV